VSAEGIAVNSSLAWVQMVVRDALPLRDVRTARNVIDHLIGHAREAAFLPEELASCDQVERQARALLEGAPC
jgi:hypothetical protein